MLDLLPALSYQLLRLNFNVFYQPQYRYYTYTTLVEENESKLITVKVLVFSAQHSEV